MDENELYPYLDRLKQVDRLLAGPIRSLIAIACRELQPQSHGDLTGLVQQPLYFPAWVSQDRISPPPKLNETSALCCATLQRLWRIRRRFPFLKSSFKKLEEKLRQKESSAEVVSVLANAFLPKLESVDPDGYKNFLLKSGIFGEWAPFTGSLIFLALLNGGESKAHSGLGFLLFFHLIWSLRRRFPVPSSAGAPIGTMPATAYVTAKCLSPIQMLLSVMRRRAFSLDEIRKTIKTLDHLMNEPSEVRTRRFPFLVDKLTLQLHNAAEVSIDPASLRDCARSLEGIAAGLTVTSDIFVNWETVRNRLASSFNKAGHTAAQILGDARIVVEGLIPEICSAVSQEDEDKLRNELGISIGSPRFVNELSIEYWDDHKQASETAFDLCKKALSILQQASQLYSGVKKEANSLIGMLDSIAIANRRLADSFERSVQHSVEWCETVVTREVANASAGRWTEFDPAELVSGLTAAVSAGRIDSPQRVRNASTQAMEGLRKDGSWLAGQPFFLDEDLKVGAWAPTSDIIWMLSRTIAKHPEVTATDVALSQFVDWLESTQQRIKWAGLEEPVIGWVSERSIRPERIDLWTTSFAINALLEIRELTEFRLWQMCEKHFTVIAAKKPLDEIEAVDLGCRHERRLHRWLARMARDTEGSDFDSADYSLVLHGPPGSSKTVVAQALSTEMWKRFPGPRLVRITPADFTRLGEDRLDFLARMIFDLLSHVRGVTVLFDEIDDLLRERKSPELSFLNLVVPAMLNRLQDLRDACPSQEVSFVLATNYIEKIEPALIRKGRIDRAIPLVYPDRESRRAIFYRHVQELTEEPLRNIFRAALEGANISRTDFWPWLSVNTMSKEVVRELLSEGDETSKRKKINALITSYHSSHSSVSVYRAERLKAITDHSELRNEFLHFQLSGADRFQEYRSKIQSLLQKVDAKLFVQLEKVTNLVNFWNDHRLERETEGFMRLVDAINQGDIPKLEALLQQGANVEEKDSQGLTPLHHAVERGSKEAVKLLLRFGADLNALDPWGWTPLMRARYKGHRAIAQVLMGTGSASEKGLNEVNLILAVRKGSVKNMKTLIRKGADINARDYENRSVLRHASESGNYETVKVLLEAGADARTRNGKKALFAAIRTGKPDIVNLLVSAGADINAHGEQGPAINQAVQWGQKESLATLIAAGANTNLDITVPDDATLQLIEAGHKQRYANVILVEEDSDNLLPPLMSLAAGQICRLRIDIGQLSTESAVQKPQPIPDHLLPNEDLPLNVVVSSSDFKLGLARDDLGNSNLAEALFILPKGKGAAKTPNGDQYIYFLLQTPADRPQARLRICYYHRGILVQSQLLVADIDIPNGFYEVDVDYTLSSTFSGLEKENFPDVPRFTMLANDGDNGNHQFTLRVEGSNQAPQTFNYEVKEVDINILIGQMRDVLRKNAPLKKERTEKELVRDLTELAPLGWNLYDLVVGAAGGQHLREIRSFLNANQDVVIEVCRPKTSGFVFPWSLLYEIPIESNKLTTCPFVDDLIQNRVNLKGLRKCPRSPHPINTLCPFGFFGYRYSIEQLSSRDRPDTKVPAANNCSFLIAQTQYQVDPKALQAHVLNLKQMFLQNFPGGNLEEGRSRLEIKDFMGKDLPIVYFYCHGERPKPRSLRTYLGVGQREVIEPSHITAWVTEWSDKGNQIWDKVRPLIFINACHSLEINSGSLVTYIDAFITRARASGVIGTEVKVSQNLAMEFARRFFDHFLRKVPVDAALREARMEFLQYGNLFGLVYTPYCLSNLHLD